MSATSPGIWLHIAKHQQPNPDHGDQGNDDHPPRGPNRHIQSSTGETSILPAQAHRPHQDIVNGFTRMVTDKLADGWSAYLVTVAFRHLPGQRHGVLNRMKDEVTRLYSTLVTRVHRKPKTAPTDELPVLVALADLPVFKWDRAKSPTSCNDGLHFHAILMLPAASRLREPLIEHFRSNADLYAGPRKLVDQIHVVQVTHDPHRVVDYVFKSVLSRRIPYDEAILVLPRTRRELDAPRGRRTAEGPVHTRIPPLPA